MVNHRYNHRETYEMVGKLTNQSINNIISNWEYFEQFLDFENIKEMYLSLYTNPDFDKDYILEMMIGPLIDGRRSTNFNGMELNEIGAETENRLELLKLVVEYSRESQIKLEYLSSFIESRLNSHSLGSPISRLKIEKLIHSFFEVGSQLEVLLSISSLL